MVIEWRGSWETPETDEEILSSLSGEIVKTVTGGEKGDYEMIITFESGKAIKVYHEQDCCEMVYIEDEESDDIVGGFVHFAGFVSGEGGYFDGDEDYSHTWSFLKIDTSKGSIWQRWLGESNGYYSEEVDVILGKVVEEGV